MTAILSRVPVDQIGSEARRIRLGRTLLTVLAAVFFTAGFAAAKVVTGAWLAFTWSAAAAKVGWQEGRKGVSRGAA